MSPPSARPVGAARLRSMIADGGEVALLDVREEGRFAQGHLLFAVPLPLSRLELRILDVVPRRSVPVVLSAGADDG
ncbi:MAG: rhodanese-like domain-containing protein, partial [Rhodospirillales bacterium]